LLSALAAAILMLASAGALAGETVALVVNSSLRPFIQTKLDRFVADLNADGFTVVVRDWSLSAEPQPSQLKAYLQSVSGLDGAIFIGDLPVVTFEYATDWNGYASWPADLYYMDFASTWSDTDGNNRLDSVSPSPSPSIWVSRIKASNMGSVYSGLTEADLVNRYFDKNHSFRQGTLRVSDRAMTYIDDDWSSYTTLGLNQLYSSVTVVNDPVTTTAADYKARWPVGHESFVVCAHSNSSYHRFYSGSGGTVNNSAVAAGDIRVLFWNLFNCSTAKYTASNYLGGCYVLSEHDGLVACGTTKTGSMMLSTMPYYYARIAEVKDHGTAYRQWFAQYSSFSSTYIKWHYGQTLLGDGTLKIGRHRDNNQPPSAAASATPTSGMVPLAVSFSGTGSSDVDGNIVSYSWDFGDGTPGASGATVSHTYTSPGTYSAALTVVDNNGASDTDTVVISVADPNVLNAPGNLTASVAGSLVTLMWDDNNAAEDGFYVERGVKRKGKTTWTRVGTAAADVVEFSETVADGTHRYRVQAFRGAETSAYSNEVQVSVGSKGGGGGGKGGGKKPKGSPGEVF
jgi:PKD repeat protein